MYIIAVSKYHSVPCCVFFASHHSARKGVQELIRIGSVAMLYCIESLLPPPTAATIYHSTQHEYCRQNS